MKFLTFTAVILGALAGVSALVSAADPPAAAAPPQPPSASPPAAGPRAVGAKRAEQNPTCHVCGGTCHLTPVCVCAPATKKKAKTTYSMKCEPVCVPEPCLSHLGKGKRHATSCTGVTCDGSCGAASVRTRKLLQKTITEEEVDIIERKAEYLCSHCADRRSGPTCCSCAGIGLDPAAEPWWTSLWPW